ncbi:HTH-type transcriptional regulator BenM [compost metagenome]
MCALPSDHPLAARDEVPLQALQNEDFVLFPRSFSPAYYDKIVAMCVRAGFTPQIRHEVRHMLSIATLVGRKFGVSLVPASLQTIALPNLSFRPLAQPEQPAELHAIWREGDPSALVHALLAQLSEATPEI